MPSKDIHSVPFDEGTIDKLEIFERYLEAWLNVFCHSSGFTGINICDFFAGGGTDSAGNEGSPLRILKILEKLRAPIAQKKMKINILLNELDKEKYNSLCYAVTEKTKALGMGNLVNVKCFQKEFKNIFHENIAAFRKMPNLFFIDQNGIKEVDEDIFLSILDLNYTDFLFFISSSYFKRFPNEFQMFFPDFDMSLVTDGVYANVHRTVCEYYRQKAAGKTNIYPFSIKKSANIYGLVFGSKHPLGVQKFLEVAWRKNELNGEANFDIDNEYQTRQGNLFEPPKLTKIEAFQYRLREYILTAARSNTDVYYFTLENGHIPKHAVEIIRKMKNDDIIDYSGQPRINYESCIKDKIQISFVVKNAKSK